MQQLREEQIYPLLIVVARQACLQSNAAMVLQKQTALCGDKNDTAWADLRNEIGITFWTLPRRPPAWDSGKFSLTISAGLLGEMEKLAISPTSPLPT